MNNIYKNLKIFFVNEVNYKFIIVYLYLTENIFWKIKKMFNNRQVFINIFLKYRLNLWNLCVRLTNKCFMYIIKSNYISPNKNKLYLLFLEIYICFVWYTFLNFKSRSFSFEVFSFIWIDHLSFSLYFAWLY